MCSEANWTMPDIYIYIYIYIYIWVNMSASLDFVAAMSVFPQPNCLLYSRSMPLDAPALRQSPVIQVSRSVPHKLKAICPMPSTCGAVFGAYRHLRHLDLHRAVTGLGAFARLLQLMLPENLHENRHASPVTLSGMLWKFMSLS